ncbi:hypothetical protein H8S75_24000 [Hungatella sp. L12]|uniref:Cyanophage baseplate Pam3 plug gp18 domain-containing protein n=1 Tax=Hungatella hominis TaxID=2763050 RepID=A0ABR7HCV4_9FIRM|nr:hypothetical protein [Hungatella hominis]MBC5711005.1 hypothetical protein [Hungatella hominis]
MRDRIIVKKELIPYGFNIALGKEKFNMRFAYNKQADLFTVSLYRDGKLLCHAEPVVYGVSLFRDVYESGVFPMPDIVPYDESGQEQSVTWENFGETVFLTIDNGK